MRLILLALAALLCWPVATGLAADPAPRFTITACAPESPATLVRDEPLHVRIRYETSVPASLWLRPRFHGKTLDHGRFSPSPTYQGVGEALAWYECSQAATVDELVVIAGLRGDDGYREQEVARQVVDLRWSGAPGTARPPAPWVAPLREQARQLARAPVGPPAGGPLMLAFGLVAPLLLLGLLAAGMLGPFWALWTWRGGLRVLALVLCAVAVLPALNIAVGLARDPTSHNLWPLELAMAALLNVAVLGAVWVGKRVAR